MEVIDTKHLALGLRIGKEIKKTADCQSRESRRTVRFSYSLIKFRIATGNPLGMNRSGEGCFQVKPISMSRCFSLIFFISLHKERFSHELKESKKKRIDFASFYFDSILENFSTFSRIGLKAGSSRLGFHPSRLPEILIFRKKAAYFTAAKRSFSAVFAASSLSLPTSRSA